MADIVALVLPFFGLILIGYVSGRLGDHSAQALGWLNFSSSMSRCRLCSSNSSRARRSNS